MGDDDELRVVRHFLDQAREALDVGLVERRVHFVQDAERAGRVAEDGHQEGHRGQRFLAARKQRDVLQALAGGRGHDVDAAFGQVGFVGEAHLALAAAEQGLEHFLEVGVDAFEGFLEAAARFGVELLDGFLGIADGIEQVLALRVQELVALLRFVILFERLRIHRAQRFDAGADFLIALLGFFNVDGLGAFRFRLLRGRDLAGGGAQFLAAGFVEILQLGLFAHQFQFDVRALLLRGLRVDAQET